MSGSRPDPTNYSTARARSVATLFDRDASLNPLESWAIRLDYTREETGLRIVRRALNDLLPGIKFDKIDREHERLLFRTVDGVVPLDLLSDGYQNIAAWIGDLLYQVTETFNDYKSPLKARGLLLIDEVDLHIHPKWQRNLLKFIGHTLPNFQILATTHSPLTAQQAGEGELHYFEREGKEIHLMAFDGAPQDLLVHQLLMSDIFGLETDESLEVEEQKARYRELRDRDALSDTEQDEFDGLSKALAAAPSSDRTNQSYSKDHLELLQQVRAELLRKQS